MTKINDEPQRERALDPKTSFIVQAPAGSGKTELLIQRFLMLLARVKQPEEVLAITFTKKSAAEMRARIILALKNASENPEPETPHAKKTWHLAQKVLQQDRQLKWNLLISPGQLRLQTIDSFNASLTRQLPIVSHFGGTPEITHDTKPLYQEAVQEFLSHLEEDRDWSDAIATILLHVDNDLNKVESLLILLLAKRDQWLRHITFHVDENALRKKLEAQLASVVTDILKKLKAAFPEKHQDELMCLLRYANQCLSEKVLDSFPGETIDDVSGWLRIRDMLFTKENEWRKKMDKENGFPPVSSFKNNDEKNLAADMKMRVADLIGQLSLEDGLKNCFKALKDAPDTTYQERQWETLLALHYALSVAAAQLKVVFQRHGKIDYIENSLAALIALGPDESPTDLTLALDHQIRHILVDEFQDTSNSQYQLLKKMTAGWEPHDGRTLFLVGDPMQSIYRFREAEVGLFIRARQQGIGQVKLEPLTLSVNFRSTPGIVNWINQHFRDVFPPVDHIATGAVSYSPSLSNQDTVHADRAISLNALMEAEDREQAVMIVDLIQKRKQQYPEDTIAILVRGRTHLKTIIPALKEANLSWQAIDIDPLTERPFIQDLMGLTRAMSHPADRIAWLTVLRAPWCGLTLADLLVLSGQDPKTGIWERLQSIDTIETLALSPEGRVRLDRFLQVMTIKMAERERHGLRAWIESTWLLLGGPACLDEMNHLDDAATYFNLLESLDQSSTYHTDLLNDHVKSLYAAPNPKADDKLKIMTIHNAKGLEFDTVILPHLERKAMADDKPLLSWMEQTRSDESTSLILAPIHATGEQADSIYEYIRREQAIRNDHERSRLLYVAVTRAKKNLDLFFTLKDEKKIPSGSLLEKLWPSIKNTIPGVERKTHAGVAETPEMRAPFRLKRLPVDWKNPITENQLAEKIAYHQKNAGFFLSDDTPRQTGTLVHQILQQISQLGADWWLLSSTANRTAYLKKHLLQSGMEKIRLDETIKNINQWIENTLQDARGRWILAKQREAQSEFRLTALVDSKPKHFIIDRTFVDENNIRWIIDYKTATLTSTDTLQTFLQNEQATYQQQMWHYFQAIREMDQRPVRMGLYFPAIPAWHEWAFDEEKVT
ncbi:MAG TPA: UvrD-helicase domain-containing protein [Gammaproteobacteria bacterium]|nr:UvrD-helicase domain-containing protein [Gammaproteobacteria bacterium]